MGTFRWLLLLTIGAMAAVADPQSIRVGLRSSIPVEVADAAYRVRLDENHVDWGPELSQALQRSTSLQPAADGTRVRQAILETLISQRIAVPVAELLPFFEESPVLVTAAIARVERRAGEDYLTLLKKTDAIRDRVLWLAAATLVPRESLLAYIADMVHFDWSIHISDRDFMPVLQFDPWPGGSTGGGVLGGVIAPLRPGPFWPESNSYQITLTGRSTEALSCCFGEHRTYLTDLRSAAEHELNRWNMHNRDMLLGILSFAHCRTCQMHPGPDYPMIRGGKAFVIWRSDEQVLKAMTEGIEEYVRECRTLFQQLQLTSFSESAIRAKVRVWVRDDRQKRPGPIPSVHLGVEVHDCTSNDELCRDW